MAEYRHRLMDYVREEIMPHRFCVGCGCGTVLNAFTNAIDGLDLDPKKMVCVSGIGCSSWIPSPYFKSDTLHTTHGRPIAFATHSGYPLLAKSMPACRMETSMPYNSSVRRNVIST